MSTPKTHPVNVSYLVVGLVFLGIAASWALQAADVVDTGQVAWLIPVTLVVAGAIGLVAFSAKTISRGRESDEVEDDPAGQPWPDETTAYDTPTYDTPAYDPPADEAGTQETQTVDPQVDETEGENR